MLDYITVFYLIEDNKMTMEQFEEWLDEQLCEAFDEGLKVAGT